VTHSGEAEPTLDLESEYRAIEAALLETARGRWFLAEHSRRSRRIETSELEQALTQLKSSMRDPPALLGRLQSELEAIEGLLGEARTRLLARDTEPEKVLPGAAVAGEKTAPLTLLGAAEDLHELAWSLQARDIDDEICEKIGRQTAVIFALSARQAQESRRSKRHAEALDAIVARVAAVLKALLHEAARDEDAEQSVAGRRTGTEG
jgi:hypothetical protein